MDLKITPSGQTIVKPTALGPVANTDTKLLIYGLFQKGRVLAQDGERESPTSPPTRPRSGARHRSMTIETARRASLEFVCVFGQDGVRPLRTPRRAPQANAYCERLIGTTRRECLDFLIPLSEEHLRRLLTEWRDYYNGARPHSSLGPGLPTTCVELPMKPDQHRHQLPAQRAVASRPVLGGLHHDYRLSRVA